MKAGVIARKRDSPEQIITKLREAEVLLIQGQTIAQACKSIEVGEQTCYRWRSSLGYQPPAPAIFMVQPSQIQKDNLIL